MAECRDRVGQPSRTDPSARQDRLVRLTVAALALASWAAAARAEPSCGPLQAASDGHCCPIGAKWFGDAPAGCFGPDERAKAQPATGTAPDEPVGSVHKVVIRLTFAGDPPPIVRVAFDGQPPIEVHKGLESFDIQLQDPVRGGAHVVELIAPGYEAASQSLFVRPGEAIALSQRLERATNLEVAVDAGDETARFRLTLLRGDRTLDTCVTERGRCRMSATEKADLTLRAQGRSDFAVPVPHAGDLLKVRFTPTHWRWGYLIAAAGAVATVAAGAAASLCNDNSCSTSLLGLLTALIAGELIGGSYALVEALRERGTASVVP